MIGTTIDDRYIVRRLIGRGGMGAVYEADHVGLGKRVAIKVMLKLDADMVARFRREARAAARIDHVNVVRIFDVGTADGRDFIAMEYLDGRDLRSVLANGALPAPRALAIARQILHGLHAIHEAGIVHRDIKPGNILLVGEDDVVKIMDFGIAMIDDATVTRTGQIIGTPQFMAPEQLAGARIDRRADIYAVALTLHMMLTGKSPYAGTSFGEVSAQQVDGPAELDSQQLGIEPHVADALRRALSRSPTARFANALEFAAALEAPPPRGLMARTVRAAKRRDEAPTVAEPRRRRWIPLAAVAAAIAVAAVVVVAMRTNTTSRSSTLHDASIVDPSAAARAAERGGKLDVAIAQYLAAFDAHPDPELLFRVGELYERLDRPLDAIHYFERYLDRAPAAKDRAAVIARLARLRPAAVTDAGLTDAAPDDAAAAPKPTRKAEPLVLDLRCRCRRDDDPNHYWLCPKKHELLCACMDKQNEGLCPAPLVHCEGRCENAAIQKTSGSWSCSIGVPSNEWKANVKPREACRGYAPSAVPGVSSAYNPVETEGTWKCSYCRLPLSASLAERKEIFAVPNKPGDTCTGYAGSNGELKKGHIECKDKWF